MAAQGSAGTARLAPIDMLRGLVIAIMSVDHASEAFNKGRFMTDSVWMWKAGTPIPPVQFLTRWITHLCAPSFVMLAGVALAISTEKRRARGESAASIDKHIATRGLLLILFEVLWMSPVMLDPGRVLFQVLYAIGASLICMTALRRLSDRALLAFGLGVIVLGEAAVGGLTALGVGRTIPAAVVISGGFYFDGRWIIAYPFVHWLAMMCLGWALGRRLLAWSASSADGGADGGGAVGARASRVLFFGGVAALLVFAVLRGVDGYGNMGLHRDDGSVLQWLHVSKYPPSITYVALELGIASLLLALFFRLAMRPGFVAAFAPLTLLGQTSLFYYLLHIHTLHLVAWGTHLKDALGAGAAWGFGLGVVCVLYPLCRWYAKYKAAHPSGLVTRYI